VEEEKNTWVDLSGQKGEVSDLLRKIPDHAKKAFVVEVLSETFESRQDLESVILRSRATHKRTASFNGQLEGKEPTRYFTAEEQGFAYQSILEHGYTPEEAYSLLGVMYSIEEAIVDEVRKRRHAPKMLQSIVRKYDEHTKQRKMKREGIMDKQALLRSSTPNDQLRRLSRYVKLHDRLLVLEGELGKVKKSSKVVEGRSMLQTKELGEVQEVLGMTGKREDKVIYLKSLGYSQKDVASMLDCSVRSVSRYWNS
tara:strand:- start:864 stop:1625 length:762 start_codon:yes stop_codon:yes gene_type:complete